MSAANEVERMSFKGSVGSILPQRLQPISVVSVVFCDVGAMSIFIVGFNKKLSPVGEIGSKSKNSRPGIQVVDISFSLKL